MEFTFGIVMTVLLLIGMIQVFIWVGADQVKQIDRHEAILRRDCSRNGLCPVQQLTPKFFQQDGYGDLVPGDFFLGEQDIRFEQYNH